MLHFTADTMPDNMDVFYKKPVPVQAKQILEPFTVDSLEGEVTGKAGDFLMKGIQGEPYINDGSIFERTYIKGNPVAYVIHGVSSVDDRPEQEHTWVTAVTLEYEKALKLCVEYNAKVQQILYYFDTHPEYLVENFCDIVQRLREFDHQISFSGLSHNINVVYYFVEIPLV